MTTQIDRSKTIWWLSTRIIRRAGEPEWFGYINSIGLFQLQEIRTIDSWCNPHAEGSGDWQLESIDGVWEFLLDDLLPIPILGKQYYLLFTDALNSEIASNHPRLKLLGYDLSDETWTSSLLNCGRWEGKLAAIAQKVNQYGLLSLEDAKTAQSLLPSCWHDNPHAIVTIWALFEVE
ncbi:hypothetical protein NIES2101_21415 [Calothrix sp. HK-06]|nr:hypothetical protein NIES2101_21415 [Calothrix sp. HK-06]